MSGHTVITPLKTEDQWRTEDNGTTSLKYRREAVSTYSSVPSSNNVKNESELKTFQIHKGTLAWRIPWTEEPGRLQSMGSRTVGHD